MKNHTHSLTVLTLTVLLAACGGGSEAPAPTTPTGATLPSDFASTQECMVGRWLLTADQAQRAITAASLPAFVSIATTGQAIVDIRANGTYTYTPSFTINMNASGERATGNTAGSVTGTWRVSSDVLTTAETSNNITSTVSGSFGTFSVPVSGGFGAGTSRILSCQPMTLSYEVGGAMPFTQTLVLSAR